LGYVDDHQFIPIAFCPKFVRELAFWGLSMTFPSLQQRWQSQPQRGEVIGVSASVLGDMVGFAIAE
jgi:hypothetical protein